MVPGHKVLVVGAGSVGSRHIRNLLALGARVSVYRYRQDKNSELAEYAKDIPAFSSLEEALSSDVDAVVVANRTDQHIPVALMAAERGRHLFIEKPLSHTMDGIEKLMVLARERKLVMEVGFMMRFHPNLVWMRRALGEGLIGEIYYVRVVAGHSLPEWRPGRDYRSSYSAQSHQGGGVVLDLSHELDYLVWWFGEVEEVAAFLGHVSKLEITSEDVAQILLRFQTGMLAQVHLDYLRPQYHRSAEVVGSRGILTWDYLSGTVKLQHSGIEEIVHRVPEGFERNTLFVNHLRAFLDRLSSNQEPIVSMEQSMHVQQVALAAHLSSQQHRFVRPASVL